jgi:peroxiredoxin
MTGRCVVVTTGPAEANQRLVAEHGIKCTVLLQEKSEVALDLYHVRGMPMGLVIDEAGNVASEVVAGAQGLLALALAAKENSGQRPDQGPGHVRANQHANGEEKPKGKANKGLAASPINRSGLTAGTPAPDFRLPRLDGNGALGLEDFRGRPLLLVFTDPDCGPCDQVAPHLQRVHRERPDVQVLLIGRRDVALNRQKAAKLGLTCPMALQKSWEVSLLYGMFATPVAYLIDEHGVIIADVAKGVEPILELIARSAAPVMNGRQPEHQGQEAAAGSG